MIASIIRKVLLVVGVNLACYHFLLAQEPIQDTQGFVTDVVTRLPVKLAIISGTNDMVRYAVSSDQSGFFALPLRQPLRGGQLVRILVTHDGYEPFDKSVVLSSARPIEIQLFPRSTKARVARIENFIVKRADTDGTVIGAVLSNLTARAIWFNELEAFAQLVMSAKGATGFIEEIAYEIALEYSLNGNVTGHASGRNTSGNSYPVTGSSHSMVDTKNYSECMWTLSFKCPFLVRIDANDKVAVELRIRSLNVKITRETKEGDFIATTFGEKKRALLKIVFKTDQGQDFECSSENRALVESLLSLVSRP
jgi:hypothetical protein